MTNQEKQQKAASIRAEISDMRLQNELIAALRAMVGDGKHNERESLAMALAALAKLEQK
jgi:hypothetical protein